MTSDDLDKKLLLLIKQGRKLDALEKYIQYTGCDLGTARKMIDSLEQESIIFSVDTSFETELRKLISHGSKINAIKLYMDTTGAGLAEAKNYIDSLSESTRRQKPEAQETHQEKLGEEKPIREEVPQNTLSGNYEKGSKTSLSGYLLIISLVLMIGVVVYYLLVK